MHILGCGANHISLDFFNCNKNAYLTVYTSDPLKTALLKMSPMAKFHQLSTGEFVTDINECDVDNGGCSDICTNTDGSYNCGCPDGLRLGFDGLTCEGKSFSK